MSGFSCDYCKKCKAFFTSDSELFCAKCRAPRRKPCILCGIAISHNSHECTFCLAPQDKHIFEKTPLKECSCGVYVMMSSAACYNCRSVLQIGYVRPQHQKMPNEPPSIELPQETSPSLSNSDAPIQETREEASNQSIVLTTPSSEQEMVSINISVPKTSQCQTAIASSQVINQVVIQHGSSTDAQTSSNITSCHSPVTDLMSSNENSSDILPTSQQYVSQKAARESNNLSQVSQNIHGNTLQDHEQLDKEKIPESGCSNYTHLPSNQAIPAIGIDSWGIQPQEVLLAPMSYPYDKSKEDTCLDDLSSLPVPATSNVTTCLSTNSVVLSSVPSIVTSPPYSLPPSHELTYTPKYELLDEGSVSPEKKRKVDIESEQHALNLSEDDGTARDSVKHVIELNDSETIKKIPDAQLGLHYNQVMPSDHVSANRQEQTPAQRKRRSTSDGFDTNILASKKFAPGSHEQYGARVVSHKMLSDKNVAQEEGNNDGSIGAESDSESSSDDKNEQHQQQLSHDDKV